MAFKLDTARAEYVEVEGTREGCSRERIFFGSDLPWWSELFGRVGGALEEHELAPTLDSIVDGNDGGADLWALIPGAFSWETGAPPVLVAFGSTSRWISCNAIALAHALTAGKYPELESMRRPDSAVLRAIAGALQGTEYDVPILRCIKPGCDYVRLTGNLGKQVTHDCLLEGGNARNLVQHQGEYHSAFDDLPACIRLGQPASYFNISNPLQVTLETLTWTSKGPRPPLPPGVCTNSPIRHNKLVHRTRKLVTWAYKE